MGRVGAASRKHGRDFCARESFRFTLADKDAAGAVIFAGAVGGEQRRDSGVALCDVLGTARSKGASGGKGVESGDRAGNGHELSGFETRRSAQQAFGIRMPRMLQHFADGTFFDDAAGVHDGDAIGNLRDDAEIVGDEEQRKLEFATQFLEKLENLLLHGDIERGGGLVGDEHAGIGGKGHGDHDALAQAAGKLMRILTGAARRIGNGGEFERAHDARAYFGFAEARLVHADRFSDLRADAHDRIERGHGLLKDHGDFASSQSADLRGRGGDKILRGGLRRAVQLQQRLAFDASAGRSETHQRERQNRFSRARFTDNAKGFAGSESEGNVVHRAHPSAASGKLDDEIADGKPRDHRTIIAGRVTRGEVLRYRLRMSKPQCPMCKAPLVNAGKLRYCVACGWQKEQTERQLRLNLKIVPIAFGAMALLLVVLFARSSVRAHGQAWLIGVFLSFPLIALVVSYAVTRRNLRKLVSQPAPTAVAVEARATGVGATAEMSAQYQALLRTAPPRQLRMSRRGRFNLSLTLIVLLIFAGIMGVQLFRAWAVAHTFANFGFREWGMTGFALLILLMLVWQWRVVDRQRYLLMNGEVAAAKVTEKFGSRNASAIKYEFEDFAGRKHVKVGTDYTQKLETGMSVPVFYDHENPDRQVPATGTFHEVIVPDTTVRAG
jgi:hypothetical protein